MDSVFDADDGETVATSQPAPTPVDPPMTQDDGSDAIRDNNNDVEKKRKAEEEAAAEEAKKAKILVPVRPKSLTYIPWQFLTKPVLHACVKFADPYQPNPNRAATIKIFFDYDAFRRMCHECPPIKPRCVGVLRPSDRL